MNIKNILFSGLLLVSLASKFGVDGTIDLVSKVKDESKQAETPNKRGRFSRKKSQKNKEKDSSGQKRGWFGRKKKDENKESRQKMEKEKGSSGHKRGRLGRKILRNRKSSENAN